MTKLMMIARQIVWNTLTQRAADVQHQGRAYAHYASSEQVFGEVDYGLQPTATESRKIFWEHGLGRRVRHSAAGNALPV